MPKNAKLPSAWDGDTFIITYADGAQATLLAHGRTLWALLNLLAAGENGCTPISNPAPRWSSYIHKLRKAGVIIETIHESHAGPFPGHHARYVLRCSVRPDSARVEVAA
jgi:hypothetical protein